MSERTTRSQVGTNFIEKNLAGLTAALDHGAMAAETAGHPGWLQSLDPRTKIIGFGLLILAVVGSRRLAVVLLLLLLAATLAAAARIPWRTLVFQLWGGVLVFTGLIALPAIFLTPGEVLCRLPGLSWPVTAQGVRTAVLLVGRSATTATLALTLVLSTRWTHVLKALRVLHVPTVLVVILGMTHRYIFLLLRLAEDFFVARRSRLIGVLDARQRRQVAAGAAGVLLDRSLQLSGEVYQAMQSRGFRGEAHTFDDFRWRTRDAVALTGFVAVAAAACWFGLK